MFERLGFHYFSDTLHYRQYDMETWLPVLASLGAKWLTLPAANQRAIPESFIRSLIQWGIQPVVHFSDLPLSQGALAAGDVRLIAQAYASWGVRYVAWFDHPNARAAWGGAWSQGELVERFVDAFLPFARLSLELGLQPVLPPLQPGGDYWDVAFLRRALKSFVRRGETAVLDNLVLGADAWVNEGGLDWGAGGPQRWPDARPYVCPPDCQDQRGFRIFDWYSAIAREETSRSLPIILLRAGKRLAGAGPTHADLPLAERLLHAQLHQTLARCLDGESCGAATPPPEVLACNLWLLAAEPDDPLASQAWFVPGQEPLPAAGALQQWVRSVRCAPAPVETQNPTACPSPATTPPTTSAMQPVASLRKPASQTPTSPLASLLHDALFGEQECLTATPALDAAKNPPAAPAPVSPAINPESSLPGKAAPAISHYVLLPLYAWGAANWDLALIEPMLSASHPTIGFSLAEAQHAARVTVVGGEGAVSVDALEMLRRSGCLVERILDDGTLIATE